MGRVVIILSLILVVHVAGRVAAVCHPAKVDSFTYSIAAYRLWHSGATAADLVADKPPGQAILTGWSYHLSTGEATRLTLVPIESAFLLSAYAVFFLIASRLHGQSAAGILTLFFVLAQNLYNALDFTTDGYNLNENYLALPMLLAVLLHLSVKRPLVRAGSVGIAIGVALLIKQSAIGLLGALLVSELLTAQAPKRVRNGLAACAMVGVGVAVAFAPVALYLWSKGWLGAHLDTLLNQTAAHAILPPWQWPRWYNISPLTPAIWVAAIGVAIWWGDRAMSKRQSVAGNATTTSVPRTTLAFLALWLIIELAVLAAMRKPASHYYQQIVAPVVLFAGLGLVAISSGLSRLDAASAAKVSRWAYGTTAALMVVAAIPLLSAASARFATMDYDEEVREFAVRLGTQSLPVAADRAGGDE